jgi:hypothetical protein
MVRCLVEELGADVTQADVKGVTPLFIAAQQGHLTVVQYLSTVRGIDINKAVHEGCTPLLISAHCGHLIVVKYLLLEVARLVEADRQGRTLWSFLDLQDADHSELTALLQAMVLFGDTPHAFIAKLAPQHAEICTRGRELRTKLPAYSKQQNASVSAHCPLPAVLWPMVAAYAAPTAEDVWTNGLRFYIVECSNPT